VTAPAAPLIVASGVSAGYGARPVLESVSFTIQAGELVALVGPNGSGKSTLLKVLAGLLPARAGTVRVLDAPPGRQPRRVAYLPQAEAVDWTFPVSVLDVVLMGRTPRIGWLRGPSRVDREIALEALRRVGMAHLAERQIGALSGGQQRRVFLARALANEPDLYLLDEPVTGVDPTTEEALMELLDAECRSGKAVFASTHDLSGVLGHFARVLCLNRTLVADGPAEILRDPDVLRATYGGHLVEVRGGTALLVDDPHHGPDHAGARRGHA